MRLELPSTEVTEAEIAVLNKELGALETEARSLGLKPVNPDEIFYPEDEYTVILPTIPPPEFWCHHMGGPLSSVNVQMYMLEETGSADERIVRSVQGRTYRLIKNWMNHPNGKNDQLNMETSNAFLKAGFSFDWMASLELTRKLRGKMRDIGDFYTMREGLLPTGFHGIISGRGVPSRAYLKCIDPKNASGV